MPPLALMNFVRKAGLPPIEPEFGSLADKIRWFDLYRIELAPQYRKHPSPDRPPSLVSIAPLVGDTTAYGGAPLTPCHASFTPKLMI
jgi:hypothetical protein